jgi:hypothetical protein
MRAENHGKWRSSMTRNRARRALFWTCQGELERPGVDSERVFCILLCLALWAFSLAVSQIHLSATKSGSERGGFFYLGLCVALFDASAGGARPAQRAAVIVGPLK